MLELFGTHLDSRIIIFKRIPITNIMMVEHRTLYWNVTQKRQNGDKLNESRLNFLTLCLKIENWDASIKLRK